MVHEAHRWLRGETLVHTRDRPHAANKILQPTVHARAPQTTPCRYDPTLARPIAAVRVPPESTAFPLHESFRRDLCSRDDGTTRRWDIARMEAGASHLTPHRQTILRSGCTPLEQGHTPITIGSISQTMVTGPFPRRRLHQSHLHSICYRAPS